MVGEGFLTSLARELATDYWFFPKEFARVMRKCLIIFFMSEISNEIKKKRALTCGHVGSNGATKNGYGSVIVSYLCNQASHGLSQVLLAHSIRAPLSAQTSSVTHSVKLEGFENRKASCVVYPVVIG